MFCPSCGTRLVSGANFCHGCGTPAGAPPGYGGPAPGPVPAARACFACGGAGKVHDSSMPHNGPGCIFCKHCRGCNGTGAVPGAAVMCPHCHGQTKVHDSTMPHNPGCIFCTDCATCGAKGWM